MYVSNTSDVGIYSTLCIYGCKVLLSILRKKQNNDDEINIGGGYNTIRLMDYFNWGNKLQGLPKQW